MNRKSRLAWRCRRGMKEMDLLLERFLAREYDALTPDQQALFDRFLGEYDQDLYAWITGAASPPDPAYHDFIHRLQDFSNKG